MSYLTWVNVVQGRRLVLPLRRARTFCPIGAFWPDAMYRPHFETATAVTTSLCPVRNVCVPSTMLLMTTAVPRG